MSGTNEALWLLSPKGRFEVFLPEALADGRFRPAPEPVVAGSGLQAPPGALGTLRAGVSAAKIIVTVD